MSINVFTTAVITIYFVICTPSLGCAQENAQALERTFSLASTEQITSAYGLIVGETPFDSSSSLTPKESTIRKANVSLRSPGNYDIVVRLKPEDLQHSKQISVIAESVSGKLIPLEITPTLPPQDPARVSTRCLSDRAKENSDLTKLDEESLNTLVQVRTTKVAVLRKKLLSLLTAETLTKLNQAEQQLGLEHAQPLSAELSVPELAKRLGALDAVIKSQ